MSKQILEFGQHCIIELIQNDNFVEVKENKMYDSFPHVCYKSSSSRKYFHPLETSVSNGQVLLL